MNWLQILSLVVQALPTLETAAIDVVQLITAVSHAASQGSPAAHAAISKMALAPSVNVAPAPSQAAIAGMQTAPAPLVPSGPK